MRRRSAIAALLELVDIKKHYPVREGLLNIMTGSVRAVDGVSLILNKGETFGLVGESGCGKSTLARLILALEKPTSGEITFQGKSLTAPMSAAEEKAVRRRMQMIFQDPYSSLNPRQRIGSIVRESLDIHGVGSSGERKEKTEKLLSLVGLNAEQARRYPHEFSGGQRQRVAIARALALDPDLVVCDEPVSALDVSIQAQVLNLLKDLQEQFDLTYLFISHNLSVIGHVSDRVAVMYLGRIVEMASSLEIFDNPLHPYTKALLSALPVPDPEAEIMNIRLTGDVPSPMSPPPGCPFHPRCPEAVESCSATVPILGETTAGHFVSCLLHT